MLLRKIRARISWRSISRYPPAELELSLVCSMSSFCLWSMNSCSAFPLWKCVNEDLRTSSFSRRETWTSYQFIPTLDAFVCYRAEGPGQHHQSEQWLFPYDGEFTWSCREFHLRRCGVDANRTSSFLVSTYIQTFYCGKSACPEDEWLYTLTRKAEWRKPVKFFSNLI